MRCEFCRGTGGMNCSECGGTGIQNCCEGLVEQPTPIYALDFNSMSVTAIPTNVGGKDVCKEYPIWWNGHAYYIGPRDMAMYEHAWDMALCR